MTTALGVLGNASWNAFGKLFNIVIAFLLAPLMINRLGIDQWGLVLLVWSAAGVLSIANFGLGEATLRYVAHYYAKKDLVGVNRVLGATLSYYVLVCTLITTVIWIATPVIAQWVKAPDDQRDALESLLRLTPLLFSAGILANAFLAIPMALHRYDISSAITLIQGIMRSIGLVVLVLAGFGVTDLVVWEVFAATMGLAARIVVARRLVPGLRCLPSMSLAGLREIIGYSVYSFIGYTCFKIYREGGKLILGNQLGTAGVAYLGTPDSVAYRLHMVLLSGIETLVPRFSASRDAEHRKALLITSTWAAFASVAVMYVPLAILMPDLLSLWINPEFAQKSGEVGRLLTLGLIGSVIFAPIAALYRGQGEPGFVAAVMAAVAIVVLAGSLLLIPSLGVEGVGYAYVVGLVPWLGGFLIGWVRLYGASSLMLVARIAMAPLALAACLGVAEAGVRAGWGAPGWGGLVLLGMVFSAIGALAVVVFDLLLGGNSPAGLLLGRVLGEERLAQFRLFLRFGRKL